MNLFLYTLLTIIKGTSIFYPNNYYQLLFLNWVSCTNILENITYSEDNNNQFQFPINNVTGLCSGNFNQYNVDEDQYQLHFQFNRNLQPDEELLIISIQGKNYTILSELMNDRYVGINHKHIQSCQKTIDFWILSNNYNPFFLMYFEITDITVSSSNKVYKDQYFNQEIALENITQYNWQTKSIQINNSQSINYQAVLNFVNLTMIESRLQAKIYINQNQMKCQYTDLDIAIYFNCNLENIGPKLPIEILQLFQYNITIQFDYISPDKSLLKKEFQAIIQQGDESNSFLNYKLENNITQNDRFKVNLQLSDYKLEDQTLQFSVEKEQKICDPNDFQLIIISIFNEEKDIYYNLEYNKLNETNKKENCIITLKLDDQIIINQNLSYFMNITIIFKEIISSPIFFYQNNNINLNQGIEEQQKSLDPQTTIILVVFYSFIPLILFWILVSIFPARYYFYILLVLNKFIQNQNFNDSLPQPTNFEADVSPYIIREPENQRLRQNQNFFDFQNQQ